MALPALSCAAAPSAFERFSPYLVTNTQILWQAPTNRLPGSIWIYRRLGPRIFPTPVVSNALALASLQHKGFPGHSTNDFYIWEDKGSNYPGVIPAIFALRPGDASMIYAVPNYGEGSGTDIPGDETIVPRAWIYASQLGLDPARLIRAGVYTHHCTADPYGTETSNNACGRGVFLSRQLDGIAFFSADGDGEGAEGFSVEFGTHGRIREFSLRWPDLARHKLEPTATPRQIVGCLRALAKSW